MPTLMVWIGGGGKKHSCLGLFGTISHYFDILNEAKTGPIVCTAKLGKHVFAVSLRRNNWIFRAPFIYRSSHNLKSEGLKKKKSTHTLTIPACI